MARSSVPPTACPGCAAPLVEIRLGAELALRSCSTCDSRWWLRADEPVVLNEVLGVVADTGGRRSAAGTVKTRH